jgi:hypothetical protein
MLWHPDRRIEAPAPCSDDVSLLLDLTIGTSWWRVERERNGLVVALLLADSTRGSGAPSEALGGTEHDPRALADVRTQQSVRPLSIRAQPAIAQHDASADGSRRGAYSSITAQ